MSRKFVNCPYCGKILPRELWPETFERKNLGIECPYCGGEKIWKSGMRYTDFGIPVQRYYRANGGHHFSKK